MEDLVIRDVTVLDCTGREPAASQDVLISDGLIRRIGRVGSDSARRGAATIDGAGCTLMPGLTDAHVHFALLSEHGDQGDDPWILHVVRVIEVIGRALDEGFTTVRDAGGLEPYWATLVAEGRVRGPRLLPSGSFISQTGGHGDLRRAHDAELLRSIPGLVARTEIVDGPDEVRKVVREQLRRGATQIKLHASGGIRSPNDPYDSVQFSREEIAAAVDAARSWGTYVLAHCLTSPSVENALDGGVRSIEHGTFLEPGTADRIARVGAFMVPTLFALNRLASLVPQFDVSEHKRKSLDLKVVVDAATKSVGLADSAGVPLGCGSDIVGPDQGHGAREIVYLAQILGTHKAILSATRTNADLFNLGDRIGTIEVGKEADLILVKGDPLANVELLTASGSIPFVMKGGTVMKDTENRRSLT
jgi:imidazolonepropionase-like amidohydrolase